MSKITPVSDLYAVALVACLAAMGSPAWAQLTNTPSQSEIDQVFRSVLDNPASIDIRTKYATLLVQNGNYEGGVAALESLLLLPDAPANIRLELAVLYYRLGSYAMAQAYLKEALADSRLDAKQKEDAQALLRDVVERNKKSRLSGMVMLGVRAQSNPISATDNGTILSQGASVPRGLDYAPKSDTDLQAWALLDHAFDLDMQNEAAVTTTLMGYTNHYDSVSSYATQVGNAKPYDLTIVAGSTGLRFKPAPTTQQGWTLRPHLLFGGATANGKSYFNTGGWGIGTEYHMSERLMYGGTYENSRQVYFARDDMANAPSLGGNRQYLRLNATLETGANRFLMTELGFQDYDGNTAPTGYQGPEFRFSYVLGYASPLSTTALPWAVTLNASAAQRNYRAPDPQVSPLVTRQDTEWRIGLINVAPVTRDVAVQLQLEYVNINSNISNFSSTNRSGTLGVIWKY